MVSYLKDTIPKYGQLKNILIKEITNGKFKECDKFYSERELMRKLNISRNTVIEAFRILENEGLIERIQGKGTFISNKKSFNNTKNIGVVIGEIFETRHPACISLLKSLEKILNKDEYHILLITLEHSSKKQQIENLFSQKKADGFILISVSGEVHDWFAERNAPFVIIGSTLLKNTSYVNVDYFKLVNEGISYLLKSGHRKIGFVACDKKNVGVMMEINGYKNACRDFGLEWENKFIITDIRDASDITKATNNLIDRGVTAILFDLGEYIVEYAINEIRHKGLKIPEDISIMITQKTKKTDERHQFLTGFEVNVQKIYEFAGKMIIDLINGREAKSKTVPYKFFKGNSCARREIRREKAQE